jgi:hypothetical protein
MSSCPEWFHHNGRKFGVEKLEKSPLSLTLMASAAKVVVDTVDFYSRMMDKVIAVPRISYEIVQSRGKDGQMSSGTTGLIQYDERISWLALAFGCYPALNDEDVDREVQQFVSQHQNNSERMLGVCASQHYSISRGQYDRAYGGDLFSENRRPYIQQFAHQRLFLRVGRFLNLPQAGSGQDGTPCVSIELDDQITQKVAEFIYLFGQLSKEVRPHPEAVATN